jgi:hypothetical protein
MSTECTRTRPAATTRAAAERRDRLDLEGDVRSRSATRTSPAATPALASALRVARRAPDMTPTAPPASFACENEAGCGIDVAG